MLIASVLHLPLPVKRKSAGSWQMIPKLWNWSKINGTANTLLWNNCSISHSHQISPLTAHISRTRSSSSSNCAIVPTSIKGDTDQMPWPLSKMKLTDNRVSRSISHACKHAPLWIYNRSKRLPSNLRVHSVSWARSLHLSKTEKDFIRPISMTQATWGIRHDRTRKLGPKCCLNSHMTRYGSDRRKNPNRVRQL